MYYVLLFVFVILGMLFYKGHKKYSTTGDLENMPDGFFCFFCSAFCVIGFVCCIAQIIGG